MGLTDPNMVTVASQKNWIMACVKEQKAYDNWYPKWGWIVEHYVKLETNLKDLKSKRKYIKKVPFKEIIDVRPFPTTTYQEIGWLSTRPDCRVEKWLYPGTKQWKNARYPKILN